MMKRRLLLIMVASASHLYAAQQTQQPAITTEQTPLAEAPITHLTELQKMHLLQQRNVVSLGGEALLKSSLKAVGNFFLNEDYCFKYISLAVCETTRVVGKTALKPVQQVYRAGKTMYLTNPHRAAERELNKLIGDTLKHNVRIEKMKKKEAPLRDKKFDDPFVAFKTGNAGLRMDLNNEYDGHLWKTDAPSLESYYHKQQEAQQENILIPGTDTYKRKLKAAEDVAAQATIGMLLFKRTQVKRAMKEAIQQTH